ncbi:hypothetical protein ACEQPO_07610 [Bacillus sp. SL00103]
MTRMLQQVVQRWNSPERFIRGTWRGKVNRHDHIFRCEGCNKRCLVCRLYTKYNGRIWMGYDKTDNSHYLTGGSQHPVRLFKDILTATQMTNETFKNQKELKNFKHQFM